MNSRLIPWCLAAITFVVALTVSDWRGELGRPDQLQPDQLAAPHADSGQRSTAPSIDHTGWRPSGALAVAPTAVDDVPTELTLPLPPATPSELDSNIQSVPDDEPTVDDLPGRPEPSASPDGE